MREAKSAAERIGPTVCDDDGPIPIVNRSNTLIVAFGGACVIATANQLSQGPAWDWPTRAAPDCVRRSIVQRAPGLYNPPEGACPAGGQSPSGNRTLAGRLPRSQGALVEVT